MDTLGELLKAWMRLNDYGLSEGAKVCRLGVPHFHNIVNEDRTDLRMATFERLSQGTGISVEKLMMAAALSRKKRLERKEPRPFEPVPA